MLLRRLIFGIILAACSVGVYAASCQKLITINSSDGGIFSLASYKGHLYLGMFGYNYNAGTSNDIMLYRYQNGSLIGSDITKQRLVVSESICAMREFNGDLYAASEERGKIFKSTNGLNFTQVNNTNHRDACDLHDNGSTLVAPQTHGGVVLHSQTGTNWQTSVVTTAGNPYIRESNYYKGYWYVWGIRRTDNSRFAYRSSDLISWTSVNTPGRIFRTSVINGVLWGSVAASPAYQTQNKIGLYTTQDGNVWDQKYLSAFDNYSHLNKLYRVGIDENRNAYVATVSSGFKPRSNPSFGKGLEGSGLVEFDLSGNYVRHLCNFVGEEYAEATVFHNGELYIGTQHGGYHIADPNYVPGYGSLYKVVGVTEHDVSESPPQGAASIVPIINLLLLD